MRNREFIVIIYTLLLGTLGHTQNGLVPEPPRLLSDTLMAGGATELIIEFDETFDFFSPLAVFSIDNQINIIPIVNKRDRSDTAFSQNRITFFHFVFPEPGKYPVRFVPIPSCNFPQYFPNPSPSCEAIMDITKGYRYDGRRPPFDTLVVIADTNMSNTIDPIHQNLTGSQRIKSKVFEASSLRFSDPENQSRSSFQINGSKVNKPLPLVIDKIEEEKQ